MKKHLSALLALCIAVLLLPSAAFAADDDTINGIMYDKEHVTVSDISYSNNQSWNFNRAGSWDRPEWLGIGDCIVSPWDGGNSKDSFEIAIKNLSVNALDNAGLFGYTSNASIKNVLLTNADIHGRNNVGAIAGASYSISSTHTVLSRSIVADSKISGTNNVGGIVGTLGNCVLS